MEVHPAGIPVDHVACNEFHYVQPHHLLLPQQQVGNNSVANLALLLNETTNAQLILQRHLMHEGIHSRSFTPVLHNDLIFQYIFWHFNFIGFIG